MKVSFYSYLHGRLWLESNPVGEISNHDAKTCIGRCHNIPKPLRQKILNEMKEMGLLEWLNRDVIKLKKKPKEFMGNVLEGYKVSL